MPDKPKRGLTDPQWDEVKKKVQAGASFSAIEKEYGIRRATVRDRATREEWALGITVQTVQDLTGHPDRPGETVQGETGQVDGAQPGSPAQPTKGRNTGEPLAKTVRRRTLATVIDMASRRAADRVDASGVTDAIADEIVDTLSTLGRLRKQMGTFLETSLRDAIAGTSLPASAPGTRDKAQFVKDFQNAYQAYLGAVRDDFGRKPGEPTNKEAQPSTVPSRIEFVVLGATGTDGKQSPVDVFPKPGEPDKYGPE